MAELSLSVFPKTPLVIVGAPSVVENVIGGAVVVVKVSVVIGGAVVVVKISVEIGGAAAVVVLIDKPCTVCYVDTPHKVHMGSKLHI
jgi:hypothetical protein